MPRKRTSAVRAPLDFVTHTSDFRAREYFNLIVDTEMDLKHLDWVTLEYYGDAVNKEPRNLLLDRE